MDPLPDLITEEGSGDGKSVGKIRRKRKGCFAVNEVVGADNFVINFVTDGRGEQSRGAEGDFKSDEVVGADNSVINFVTDGRGE